MKPDYLVTGLSLPEPKYSYYFEVTTAVSYTYTPDTTNHA